MNFAWYLKVVTSLRPYCGVYCTFYNWYMYIIVHDEVKDVNASMCIYFYNGYIVWTIWVLHLVNPDMGWAQQNFDVCLICFVKATKVKATVCSLLVTIATYKAKINSRGKTVWAKEKATLLNRFSMRLFSCLRWAWCKIEVHDLI